MKNIYAIIPARSGSKGVPNKNIKKLAGFSLLKWSINACKKCKMIDRIIVNTDSEEYAKEAMDSGAEIPFIRPKEISGDFSTDFQFISHSLNWFRMNDIEPSLIVHIRPTTPLRDPIIIDKAIKLFINKNDSSSLRSVHKMSESAYKSFEISSSGFLKLVGSMSSSIDVANKPRQTFNETYIANGYVDVLSVDFINANKQLHGDKAIPFETPISHEVDTIEDFNYLEYLVKSDPKFAKLLFN